MSPGAPADVAKVPGVLLVWVGGVTATADLSSGPNFGQNLPALIVGSVNPTYFLPLKQIVMADPQIPHVPRIPPELCLEFPPEQPQIP